MIPPSAIALRGLFFSSIRHLGTSETMSCMARGGFEPPVFTAWVPDLQSGAIAARRPRRPIGLRNLPASGGRESNPNARGHNPVLWPVKVLT